MPDVKMIHYTDSIHYEMEQTVRIMKKLSVQTFHKLNIEIAPDEYSTLDTISINAGICQRDLAKLILKDRANTGRILDSLEARGYITRFIDTKGNRLVKKVGITELGYNELNAINKKLEGYLNNLSDSLHRKVSHKDILKMREILKGFREDLETVVELNI